MAEKRVAKWRRGEWCRRVYEYKGQKRVAEGYEMDFLLDGQIQVSFVAVPDWEHNVFKLRGTIIFRYARYVPKTRELPFGSEDKSFEIDV